MKLEKFIIQDFRGLKGNANVLDFKNSNIIFLIGQNNVGKSTYLRGYEFFVNSKQEATKEDFYNYDIKNPIIMEGWFSLDIGDDKDEDYVGSGKFKDPDWVEKWVDSKTKLIKVRKIWRDVGKFEKYTYSPEKSDWVPNGFGGMDSLFTKCAPKPIAINAMEDQEALEEKVNKLIQDVCIKKMNDTYPDLCSAVISSIKELQDAMLQADDINNLNEELNTHFHKIFNDLTLKIYADKDENLKIEDAFKKNHTIIVQKDNSNRVESFLQNGHGIIRQALFNFLTF